MITEYCLPTGRRTSRTGQEPLIETLISELNKLEISVTKKSSSETAKPNTNSDRIV